MELILSIDDFRYIKNLRTYHLSDMGEYYIIGDDSFLNELVDTNKIDKILIKNTIYYHSYHIYYFQDDNVILSQEVLEEDNHLVDDLPRKMRYEKRKEVLSLIL